MAGFWSSPPGSSHGAASTPGVQPFWYLRLADQNCVRRGAAAGTNPGQPRCINGLNRCEAAVVYTPPGGTTWYFPAGVSFKPHYQSADSVIRIFKALVWVYDGDDDGNPMTEPVPMVQAVDYTYTVDPDVAF